MTRSKKFTTNSFAHALAIADYVERCGYSGVKVDCAKELELYSCTLDAPIGEVYDKVWADIQEILGGSKVDDLLNPQEESRNG